MSPSTIEKLLSSISAGKIKSLAGLDDTDATTGYENFENMRSLVRTLNDVARFGDSNAARDLISKMTKCGIPLMRKLLKAILQHDHTGQQQLKRFRKRKITKAFVKVPSRSIVPLLLRKEKEKL